MQDFYIGIHKNAIRLGYSDKITKIKNWGKQYEWSWKSIFGKFSNMSLTFQIILKNFVKYLKI